MGHSVVDLLPLFGFVCYLICTFQFCFQNFSFQCQIAEFWLSMAKEAWSDKKVDWDLKTSVDRNSFKRGCYNRSLYIFLRGTHQLSDLSSCGFCAVCELSQSSMEWWKHLIANHGFVLAEQLLSNLSLVKSNEWAGGAEASTNKLSAYLSIHTYLHHDI